MREAPLGHGADKQNVFVNVFFSVKQFFNLPYHLIRATEQRSLFYKTTARGRSSPGRHFLWHIVHIEIWRPSRDHDCCPMMKPSNEKNNCKKECLSTKM